MLRVRTAAFFAAACLGAGILPTPIAAADVRRCTTADGGTLYTDRPCAAVGAEERPARGLGQDTAARAYRGGCPRRLQDLVYEVTAAIDNGDPNRLAGVYHWPGQSTRSGNAVMDRLDRITRQPLVDITALRPPAPVHVEHEPGVSPGLHDDGYHPQVASSRAPVALRIDQTTGDGGVPRRTTFGLRRHMDCWWITL